MQRRPQVRARPPIRIRVVTRRRRRESAAPIRRHQDGRQNNPPNHPSPYHTMPSCSRPDGNHDFVFHERKSKLPSINAFAMMGGGLVHFTP